MILVEEPEPEGPFGAKGVGEIGLVPTAAAVAGALEAFDGIRRYDAADEGLARRPGHERRPHPPPPRRLALARTREPATAGRLVRMKKLSFVVASCARAAWPLASDQEWPGLRGPHHDGGASGRLEATEGAGFAVAWRAALGSGYSSVAVAGGRAVTLFSDGVNDVAVAFDSRSGRELWRSVIAPTLRGKDGSFDGPIATPVLAGDRVFGLGPRGHLFALDAATGRALWKVDLVERETSAVAPLRLQLHTARRGRCRRGAARSEARRRARGLRPCDRRPALARRRRRRRLPVAGGGERGCAPAGGRSQRHEAGGGGPAERASCCSSTITAESSTRWGPRASCRFRPATAGCS